MRGARSRRRLCRHDLTSCSPHRRQAAHAPDTQRADGRQISGAHARCPAHAAAAPGSAPFARSVAPEVRTATLTINMTRRGDRHGVSKQEIETQLRDALAALPGARVKVGFGGSSEKYVLVLAGEDGRVLAQHAAQVERELRTIPGIGAVTSTASLVRPELIVRPDFARAADLGVTSTAI